MTLEHVPRSAKTLILGEAADLALAAGIATVPSTPPPNPVSRTPAEPLVTGALQ
jgi:hypothetical protein